MSPIASVFKQIYLCPQAGACKSKACPHKVKHPQDCDECGDHCGAVPKYCPACELVENP